MKLLLDTHILLWTLADDARLPDQARMLVENADNAIYYSIASLWGVETKHVAHPDKLAFGSQEVDAFCRQSGFRQLPIKMAHISALAALDRKEGAPPHKDPFDRIMVCQASVEGMLLVTSDEKVAGYANPCILKV